MNHHVNAIAGRMSLRPPQAAIVAAERFIARAEAILNLQG